MFHQPNKCFINWYNNEMFLLIRKTCEVFFALICSTPKNIISKLQPCVRSKSASKMQLWYWCQAMLSFCPLTKRILLLLVKTWAYTCLQRLKSIFHMISLLHVRGIIRILYTYWYFNTITSIPCNIDPTPSLHNEVA